MLVFLCVVVATSGCVLLRSSCLPGDLFDHIHCPTMEADSDVWTTTVHLSTDAGSSTRHDVPVVMMCPVLLGADSVPDHYRTVLSYTIHLCPALLGADSGLCPIDRLSTLEIVSQLKMTVPCSTEG